MRAKMPLRDVVDGKHVPRWPFANTGQPFNPGARASVRFKLPYNGSKAEGDLLSSRKLPTRFFFPAREKSLIFLVEDWSVCSIFYLQSLTRGWIFVHTRYMRVLHQWRGPTYCSTKCSQVTL